MEPLGLDDVVGRERYGLGRDAIRRRVIEYKRARRVKVGELLTLMFEDRATVWYQTQEMLWVEHISDLDAVRAEIAVYNQLLPAVGELAATLFIEVADAARIADELSRLLGIDEHLLLRVGDLEPVRARFESGRQTAEKLSAVQYVRFALPDRVREGVLAGAPMAIETDHPSYGVSVRLPERVRMSLAGDLAGGAAVDAVLQELRDAC